VSDNAAQLVAWIALCTVIGSCTYNLSETDRMNVCVKAQKEYVNGDCITPGSGVR
jgi:hypothetical protein